MTAACTSGDSATKYSESPNEEFEKNQIQFFGQTILKRPHSAVESMKKGDLKVVPIIAIDFSKGNLTF